MPRRTTKVTATEATIGSRIAAIRQRTAMPQVELAAKLGLSQSLLSRYERGTLRLHGALITQIAKTLGVSADELLGIKEIKANGTYDRRFIRRLQQIEVLPRRKKQALLSTIDSVLRGETTASRDGEA